MGLGIDELFRRIGIDKIRVQFINETLINARMKKRGVALTFYTEETTVGAFMQDDPEMIGIVAWVPYKDFRAAQKAWKDEQAEAGSLPERVK